MARHNLPTLVLSKKANESFADCANKTLRHIRFNSARLLLARLFAMK
jgi:hypothetical protein